MASSALEQEIQHALIRLNSFFKSHDRGVLLGLLFACIPILPLALVGLVLSLLNLWLWRNQKLDTDEIRIIRPALLIGSLNLLLGALLLHFILTALYGLDWLKLLEYWLSWIKGALYYLWPFDWPPHRQGGTSV